MSTHIALTTPQHSRDASRRLFFLDAASGCMLSANTDGSDFRVIVDRLDANDGSALRSDLGGLDGSAIETRMEASGGVGRAGADARKWCVGIAVDAAGGKIYWTQKGGEDPGEVRICRGSIDLPPGQAADCMEIELLYENLPEPIDPDLDLGEGMLYGTGRVDPSRADTVASAPLDPARTVRPAPEILFSHLMLAIDHALDHKGRRMFVTDFPDSYQPCARRRDQRPRNEQKRGLPARSFLLWTLRLDRKHA